jgi:hypothetical protein
MSQTCHERTRGFLLDHSRPLDVTAYTKEKGRLRCHKRPKSREERPRSAAIAGWGGRYRITLAKTIAISDSIERRETSGIQRDQGSIPRFMALALKADYFRKGSKATVWRYPHHFRFSPQSRHTPRGERAAVFYGPPLTASRAPA